VTSGSLKSKLIRNVWRAVGPRNRTDVLAHAFDGWWFDEAELERLDPGCRWIFNAANLRTGVRFGFERDVVGDFVVGLASTTGSGLRVAQAVAASAAVPGAFAAMRIDQVTFPCAGRGVPELLDGGAYDNSGLEALDSDRYRDVFTISLNAGGVFVTGGYGKIPLVRDLMRANSLLYRQSTALRTRWMVDRFEAQRRADESGTADPSGRRGVLFGLASDVGTAGHTSPEFEAFAATHPERRTFPRDGADVDLAFVPTVFDQLDERLVNALVYRGWWLTGATLALYHPGFAPLPEGVEPPPP
jgi:NTE family protein